MISKVQIARGALHDGDEEGRDEATRRMLIR
jgi:hypothetical protein